MVEPVAGLAFDPRPAIAEVRKPDGIPTRASSAMITSTAATAAAGKFHVLMSSFQTAASAHQIGCTAARAKPASAIIPANGTLPPTSGKIIRSRHELM